VIDCHWMDGHGFGLSLYIIWQPVDGLVWLAVMIFP